MEGVNHIKLPPSSPRRYERPHDPFRNSVTAILEFHHIRQFVNCRAWIFFIWYKGASIVLGLLRRSLSAWTVWVMSGPVNGTEQTQNRIGRRRLNTRRPRSDRKSIGLSVLCRNTVRFVWNAQKRDFINSIIKLRQILFRVAISSYLLVIRIENRCVNNSFLVVDLDKLCNTVSTQWVPSVGDWIHCEQVHPLKRIRMKRTVNRRNYHITPSTLTWQHLHKKLNYSITFVDL